MCGRFTLTATGEELVAEFDLTEVPQIEPRYNIAPTQSVLAIRGTIEQQRRLARLHWGLIPPWARDPSMAARMINARAETLAEKPAFRDAFRNRRCLIPCTGFYEWREVQGSKRKQPFLIRMADRSLFALAGLWERGRDTNGDPIESCAVITTAPNKLMQTLHDRMPVILAKARYDQWLDVSNKDTSLLSDLLLPFPDSGMVAFPVGFSVNNARVDLPECIVPTSN